MWLTSSRRASSRASRRSRTSSGFWDHRCDECINRRRIGELQTNRTKFVEEVVEYVACGDEAEEEEQRTRGEHGGRHATVIQHTEESATIRTMPPPNPLATKPVCWAVAPSRAAHPDGANW